MPREALWMVRIVPHSSSSRFARWERPRPSPRVVPAGGDAQHSAHRGHPMMGLIRLHELEDLSGIVPVSRANQAAAFFNISRSSRSWRFSRRSRRTSSSSKLVRPSSRRPSSRSAWRTQLRIADAEHSNSRASSPGARPVRTRATRTPSGAGTPAHTAVVSSTSGHLLCAMFRCPPNRINFTQDSASGAETGWIGAPGTTRSPRAPLGGLPRPWDRDPGTLPPLARHTGDPDGH